ncbi:tyrosine-type recombinase/integrase [Chitinimonas koreensis]|uniref:tyrosine-type recombinase/integrase n=1 Tax=Chitinimonas koreensis TaxID=356302 RepID=UPI0022407837|nr:tyrosine-type recombinase/integrase [Chitinimonas koreensis]
MKPSGVKAWRYRFTLGGKASMYALGEYPSVTLAEARERSEAARKLVKQGINPAQQRQLDRIRQAHEANNTFEVVAREWLQTKDWEDVTKNRRLDMLERVVFPAIGKMPVRDVTPAHVLDILQKTFKRGAPTVAAEARRTMSAVFEFAVATLRADGDPVWPVRKALPANKTQHKTALATGQIGKLLVDFDNHRGTFQTNYCMQLMWWTLARPSEVAEAEWSEFDLDAAIWRIPAARMKARKDHVVPLPRQAVEMLKGLQGVTGNRKHLFPGRDDRNGPMSVASLRQALNALGWGGTYSPHATRTTGSTRLNEMGYRPDAIEAQLAHADQNNVRRTYNHATYFDERKVMMQDWADHLESWKKQA